MIRWLHISDLHIKKKADWLSFQIELERKCLSVGKIHLVIATGDFHNFSDGSDFSVTKVFLKKLIEKLGLDIKKDLFIIPGNHDGVTGIGQKDLVISAVKNNPIDCNPMWIDSLIEMFADYESFVKDLVPDYPVEHPAKVHNRVWNNKINFIHCNTAIGADGASKNNQLLDVDALASANFIPDKPNIILAHNSFYDLNPELQKRVKDIIRNNSICAYFCGDKHIQDIDYIVYEDKQRKQIPCVVSYNSAPVAADDYSTFGIIIGEWEETIAKLRGWIWKSGVGFTVDQIITEKEINMGIKCTQNGEEESFSEKNPIKNKVIGRIMNEGDSIEVFKNTSELENTIITEIVDINTEKERKLTTNKTNYISRNIKLDKLSEIQVNKRHYFSRPELIKNLSKRLDEYNVIVVEGAVGIGKKYIIRSYFKYEQEIIDQERVYIYYAQKDESFDEFYLNLKTKFEMSSNSRVDQYHEILDLFLSRVLIIVNIHNINKESFIGFINYAIEFENKVNIILLSDIKNVFIDDIKNLNSLGNVLIEGFTEDEIRQYFDKFNCKVEEKYIKKLAEEEFGRPQAIFKFLHCVVNEHLSPDLIFHKGIISRMEIDRKQISKIISRLSNDEKALMQTLSLQRNPFKFNFVKYVTNRICKEYGSKFEANKVFTKLINNYIVKIYSEKSNSEKNFFIPDYIADIFEQTIKNKNLYKIVGDFNRKNYYTENNNIPQKISFGVHSCQCYQNAGFYMDSEKLLFNLGKDALKIGSHELLISIFEKQIKFDNSSKWFKYQLAKAYVLTGRFDNAKRVLKHEVNEFENIVDENLKVAIIHLYAQVKYEQGNAPITIIHEMEKQISSVDFSNIKEHISSQYNTVRLMLLINIDERLDEGMSICNLIIDNEKDRSTYALAIALTRREIIKSKKGMKIDVDNLYESISIFNKKQDRRGEAWAYTVLGELLLIQNQITDEVIEYIDEGITLNRKMNIHSRDYYNTLLTLGKNKFNSEIDIKIGYEIERLRTTYTYSLSTNEKTYLKISN